MDLGSLGILVLSLVAMGGIVALALRLSRRTYDRLRERVLRTEEAMRAVSAETGLALRAFDAEPHPVVGPIPGFPRLGGTHRGHRVRVEVHVESASEGGGTCTTRFVLEKPTMAPWPSVGRLRRADREDRIGASAIPRLRAIERRVHSVVLEYGVLRADARGDRTGSGISFAYDLLLDPCAIVALLDDLVSLAESLGR